MKTEEIGKKLVSYYIDCWLDWRTTGDRDMKISLGARMGAAIEISKRLKIPASMFAKARKSYE